MILHEKNTDLNLAADAEDVQLLEKDKQDPEGRRNHIKSTVHIFFLYCVIASLIVIVLALFTARNEECKDPSQGIYSPAQDVIEYETRVFDENFQSKGPYMGRPDGSPDAGIPTDETDALWEDLYQFGVSQISYSAARQLPNATEWIPGSDDQYIVELDVFHQLHCLNAIRKTFFPERYRDSFEDYWLDDGSPPGRAGRNYTSTDAKHYDHCIDALRQSVMCHGDLATVYWRWLPPRNIPLPRLEITHTCRVFDRIRDWGKKHQIIGGGGVKGDEPRWQKGPREGFRQSFAQGVN